MARAAVLAGIILVLSISEGRASLGSDDSLNLHWASPGAGRRAKIHIGDWPLFDPWRTRLRLRGREMGWRYLLLRD